MVFVESLRLLHVLQKVCLCKRRISLRFKLSPHSDAFCECLPHKPPVDEGVSPNTTFASWKKGKSQRARKWKGMSLIKGFYCFYCTNELHKLFNPVSWKLILSQTRSPVFHDCPQGANAAGSQNTKPLFEIAKPLLVRVPVPIPHRCVLQPVIVSLAPLALAKSQLFSLIGPEGDTQIVDVLSSISISPAMMHPRMLRFVSSWEPS
jgi:hypothetical protein